MAKTNLHDTEFLLELSKGNVRSHRDVHKYGRAPNGCQTTATDIWARADATPTQQIWLAPTAARVHAIVSSSASDTAAGVGARTVIIQGLTSWTATLETEETVILNGTSPVNTVSPYVIINRMKVTSSGATSINVGTITATAATDSTVGALIRPAMGQTEQAIYGVSSTQTLYIAHYAGSLNDASAGSRMDLQVLINEFPHLQSTIFIPKYSVELSNQGSSRIEKDFHSYLKVVGPAIVKLQAIANAADIDISAGFDAILVTP